MKTCQITKLNFQKKNPLDVANEFAHKTTKIEFSQKAYLDAEIRFWSLHFWKTYISSFHNSLKFSNGENSNDTFFMVLRHCV